MFNLQRYYNAYLIPLQKSKYSRYTPIIRVQLGHMQEYATFTKGLM